MEMFIHHHKGRYMKYNARKTYIKTEIYIQKASTINSPHD